MYAVKCWLSCTQTKHSGRLKPVNDGVCYSASRWRLGGVTKTTLYLYINRGRYVHAILCPRPCVAAEPRAAKPPRVAAELRAAKPRVRVSRRSRLSTALRAGTASIF